MIHKSTISDLYFSLSLSSSLLLLLLLLSETTTRDLDRINTMNSIERKQQSLNHIENVCNANGNWKKDQKMKFNVTLYSLKCNKQKLFLHQIVCWGFYLRWIQPHPQYYEFYYCIAPINIAVVRRQYHIHIFLYYYHAFTDKRNTHTHKNWRYE